MEAAEKIEEQADPDAMHSPVLNENHAKMELKLELLLVVTTLDASMLWAELELQAWALKMKPSLTPETGHECVVHHGQPYVLATKMLLVWAPIVSN